MKTSIPLKALFASFVLAAIGQTAHAQNLYFRPVGPGGNPSQGGTYEWNTSLANWYSTASGGSATTWNNSGTAYIPTTTATGSAFTVQLSSNISAAGISNAPGSTQTSGANINFSSADILAPITLALSEGAIVQNNNGNTRSFTFSNMNITGNFTVRGSGRVNFSNVNFSGTITSDSTSNLNGLALSGSTNANVIIAEGSHMYANAAQASFSTLMGSGTLSRIASGSTLTLNQSANTRWAGQFAGDTWKFSKSSTGTLIIDGDKVHTITNTGTALSVDGGSLYMNGSIAEGAGNVTIASGATFGGTVVSSRTLVLSSSNSAINPGMATLDELTGTIANEAGTLTLANGITAAGGGTFNFYMDGVDDETLVNSQILVTGGTISLSDTKTVNLYSLGSGLLQTGVAYTLFDGDGAASRLAGWDSGWVIGATSGGLSVESFGFVGNELQVVFSSVPEPSTWALIGLGALAFLFRRRVLRPSPRDQRSC